MGLGMGFAMANKMVSGTAGSMPAMGAAAPPPPPAPAAAWHVAANGQTLGPYTMQQMASGVSAGQLTAETLVWSAGMPSWVAAGQVGPLASLFAMSSAPPPPPPPTP